MLVTDETVHWVFGKIKKETFGIALQPSSLPLGAYTSLQVPVAALCVVCALLLSGFHIHSTINTLGISFNVPYSTLLSLIKEVFMRIVTKW